MLWCWEKNHRISSRAYCNHQWVSAFCHRQTARLETSTSFSLLIIYHSTVFPQTAGLLLQLSGKHLNVFQRLHGDRYRHRLPILENSINVHWRKLFSIPNLLICASKVKPHYHNSTYIGLETLKLGCEVSHQTITDYSPVDNVVVGVIQHRQSWIVFEVRLCTHIAKWLFTLSFSTNVDLFIVHWRFSLNIKVT